MEMGLSRYLSLSLVACTLLGACKGKDTGTTADTTVPAMKAAPGDTTGGAAGAAGTASGAALSDANTAALLDEANAGDSALGAAALPKLSSTSAKNFAKLMMGEHHALHIEGLNVEAAQHITPQLPTADPFKAAVVGEQTALNSMAKGRAYDSTYIANEIGIHQAVISWAGTTTPQNAASECSTPAVHEEGWARAPEAPHGSSIGREEDQRLASLGRPTLCRRRSITISDVTVD